MILLLYKLVIYRNTKVAGKMRVSKIPAPNIWYKIGVTARKGGGIAAIDDGDSGRISGVSGSGGFEGTVSNDSIVVGKVEEVLHHEMVSTSTARFIIIS